MTAAAHLRRATLAQSLGETLQPGEVGTSLSGRSEACLAVPAAGRTALATPSVARDNANGATGMILDYRCRITKPGFSDAPISCCRSK